MRRRGGPHAASAGIYGLVVSASVMSASGEHGTVADVAVSVLVAVVVYWVADAFSEVLGHQVVADEPTPRSQVTDLLRKRWALVEASYAPVLVLVIARAVGAGTGAAIDSGLGTATFLLAAFGWMAGVRRGRSTIACAGMAIITGGLGLVMIALKTALH